MTNEHPFTPKIEDDHQCQIRRTYDTKRHAQAAALSIFNRTGAKRCVEHCRHCYGWHLGGCK